MALLQYILRVKKTNNPYVYILVDLHADGIAIVRPRAEPQRAGVLSERPIGEIHVAKHPVPSRWYPMDHTV